MDYPEENQFSEKYESVGGKKNLDSDLGIHPVSDFLTMVIVSFISCSLVQLLIWKARPVDVDCFDFGNSFTGVLFNYLIFMIFFPVLQFLYILPGYLCRPIIRNGLKFVFWFVLGLAPIMFANDKVLYIVPQEENFRLIGIFGDFPSSDMHRLNDIKLIDTGIVQSIRFSHQNISTNPIYKFERSNISELHDAYYKIKNMELTWTPVEDQTD